MRLFSAAREKLPRYLQSGSMRRDAIYYFAFTENLNRNSFEA